MRKSRLLILQRLNIPAKLESPKWQSPAWKNSTSATRVAPFPSPHPWLCCGLSDDSTLFRRTGEEEEEWAHDGGRERVRHDS